MSPSSCHSRIQLLLQIPWGFILRKLKPHTVVSRSVDFRHLIECEVCEYLELVANSRACEFFSISFSRIFQVPSGLFVCPLLLLSWLYLWRLRFQIVDCPVLPGFCLSQVEWVAGAMEVMEGESEKSSNGVESMLDMEMIKCLDSVHQLLSLRDTLSQLLRQVLLFLHSLFGPLQFEVNVYRRLC